MDRAHNEAFGGPKYDYGKRSTDTPRLQKKISTGRARSENLAQQRSQSINSAATDGRGYENNGYQSYSERPQPGQRKGSLRNVVRRIFGRNRARENAAEPSKTSPPRHKYHKSEPPQLSPPREQSEYEEYRHDLAPQRIFSAPLQLDVPSGLSRVRSPYAVEFPQSARLKPLNLGNPYYAPGSTLRRRKTLPSILVATDPKSAEATSPVEPSTAPPVPRRSNDDDPFETPTPEIGLAVSGKGSSNRRSRSAGDLKWRDFTKAKQPERKRSEEIQFWRESFQGSVLRASGFLLPPPEQQDGIVEETQREPPETTPTRQKPLTTSRNVSHARQVTLGTLENSSPFDLRSNSALGTDMSRDLEDRVAKLEANLQSFQQSLQRMQAEKNRRTVVVGDYPQVERSHDSRTPSMLADDLHVTREPSKYDYSYEPTDNAISHRPLTAPQPSTPPRHSDEPPIPHSSPPYTHAHSSSSATANANPRSRSSVNLSANSDPDFRSLYNMLSTERSARRALENQMRGLRTEVQDLQYQVQTQSRVQSTRNSYMLSHDASTGSARLRDLLRDTEASPGTSPAKDRSAIVGSAGFVSRFSGSTRQDSEGGAVAGSQQDEEAQTPYDAYQTPLEGRSPYAFGRDSGGEMF